MCVESFIRECCLNKSNRINTKIDYNWFANRNIVSKLDEIVELTNYLGKDEKIPFRIFNILFKLHETKHIIKGSRTLYIRDKWADMLLNGLPEV